MSSLFQINMGFMSMMIVVKTHTSEAREEEQPRQFFAGADKE
jgi:hypothetical protein